MAARRKVQSASGAGRRIGRRQFCKSTTNLSSDTVAEVGEESGSDDAFEPAIATFDRRSRMRRCSSLKQLKELQTESRTTERNSESPSSSGTSLRPHTSTPTESAASAVDSPPNAARRPFLVLQLDQEEKELLEEFYSYRADKGDARSEEREDVLVSPAISPVPWAKDVPTGAAVRRTAINPTESTATLQVSAGRQCVTLQVPSVRLPIRRRGSAASCASDCEEENDAEPSCENARLRDRRAAIYNSKNFIGEAKSPDRSPNESGNEDNGGEETKRRRSSLELNVEVLPRVDILKEKSRKILKKQNTIADLTQKTLQSVAGGEDGNKRRGMSLLKLIDKKRNKTRDITCDLQEALANLRPSEFRDAYLMSFKTTHWKDLFDKDAPHSVAPGGDQFAHLSETERLRREAVWELFKSELVFLIDYLMVLKHCFLEPLKKLQVDGHLMFVEPEDLFGNIDELCYVSYTFSRDLISILSKEAKKMQFGTTAGLLRAFRRWGQSSRNGEVFHNYCLNYHCAVSYLEVVRRQEQFAEFEKWCELDPRCHRLQVTDLMVAPMQHCTKTPLLLTSIRKYTADDSSRALLTENLRRLEDSLQSLEDKLKWLRNFERLQSIQQQLIWPPITELEARVFIPEFLRSSLSSQPCEKLIANPKRQLVHEGFLSLVEANRSLEIYCFLFDDILLITKVKKPPKKRSVSESSVYSTSPTEGAVFVVLKQPIALDRFSIHDVGFVEANANGLRHAFVLIHISRFQQIIGVYTLQAAADQQKMAWLDNLRQSQQKFQERMKRRIVKTDSPDTRSQLITRLQRLHMRQRRAPATRDTTSEWTPAAEAAASACAACGSRRRPKRQQKSPKESPKEASASAEQRRQKFSGGRLAAAAAASAATTARGVSSSSQEAPVTDEEDEDEEEEEEESLRRRVGSVRIGTVSVYSPPLSPPPQLPNKFMGMQQPRSKAPQHLSVASATLSATPAEAAASTSSSSSALSATAAKPDRLCLSIDLRPRSSSDVREIDMSPDSPVAAHQERSASVGVIGTDLSAGRQLSIIDEDQLDLQPAAAAAAAPAAAVTVVDKRSQRQQQQQQRQQQQQLLMQPRKS